MNNQQQECVKIQVQFQEKKIPTAAQIRNRRYKKLHQLRNNGFFSQDSIKLRHPLLYHTYLGNHSQKSTGQQDVNCTLSQFLQKNLINLEYRQKLAEELNNKIEDEGELNKKDEEDDNWQILEEVVGEVALSKEGIKNSEVVQNWEVVQEQQIQLQEENLIDHAQQLFLEGKVDKAYINYAEIDNCSDYDSVQEENIDAEERYFNTADRDEAEEDERINRQHYTGIQDY